MSILDIVSCANRLADTRKMHREALLESRNMFERCPVNKEAAIQMFNDMRQRGRSGHDTWVFTLAELIGLPGQLVEDSGIDASSYFPPFITEDAHDVGRYMDFVIKALHTQPVRILHPDHPKHRA